MALEVDDCTYLGYLTRKDRKIDISNILIVLPHPSHIWFDNSGTVLFPRSRIYTSTDVSLMCILLPRLAAMYM